MYDDDFTGMGLALYMRHSEALTAAYGPSDLDRAISAEMAAERDGDLRAEWFYSGGNPEDAGAFAAQYVRTNGTMIEERI